MINQNNNNINILQIIIRVYDVITYDVLIAESINT